MIDTWGEEQRHDYAKVLKERKAAMERGRQRRQREQEALEWQRQQKAQQEREELWAWYANDYEVAESFEAQERAREAVRQRELQADISTTLLLLEVEKVPNN